MTEASLRRIHAVTRHYATLRGGATRVIWLIATFAGLHGLYLIRPGRSHANAAVALLILFGAPALGFTALVRVWRWMDRRFGRVRSARELLKGELSVAALWGYMAANYLDKRYALSDAPSIVFLGSAAFGAWLVLSVGRYGLHNLLPAVVSLIAAMGLVGVDDKASFETWQWNAMRVTALAWLAAGLIDLGLLWKTLGCQAPCEDGVADAS